MSKVLVYSKGERFEFKDAWVREESDGLYNPVRTGRLMVVRGGGNKEVTKDSFWGRRTYKEWVEPEVIAVFQNWDNFMRVENDEA